MMNQQIYLMRKGPSLSNELEISHAPKEIEINNDEVTDEEQKHLNCWIAPGFDPLAMMAKMERQLNGQGCYIEQSYVYLDQKSALDWDRIVNHSSQQINDKDYPIEEASTEIMHVLGGPSNNPPHRLKVIALGPGTGEKEVLLTQAILNKQPDAPDTEIRLYLLDISQPLLSRAVQFAEQQFKGDLRVIRTAIQGNMHDLPSYNWVIHTHHKFPIPRLITMLGYTFGNLDNEIRFLGDTLNWTNPGDLLLIDFGVVNAPDMDAEDVLEKEDPYLSERQPSRRFALENWIIGPLQRYREGTMKFEVKEVLDKKNCIIPGSYAVDFRVIAKMSENDPNVQQFSMLRIKRYDIKITIQAIQNTGIWSPIAGWKFGLNKDRLLYLFKRV